MRIADRATLFGLIRDPRMHFGDAYSAGRLEITGDLVQLLESIYRGGSRDGAKSGVLQRLAALWHRPRANSVTASRDNIHHHYDSLPMS